MHVHMRVLMTPFITAGLSTIVLHGTVPWMIVAAVAVVLATLLVRRFYCRLRDSALYKFRLRISRDLHDEIGSTLSAIALMNEIAVQDSAGLQLQQKIGASIQKAQNAMSDIVWMINPRNDSLENLVLRFGEVAAELLEARSIYYTLSAAGIDRLTLPMDSRRELYLIYKEALTNIVKYAAATQASIELRADGRQLHLRIADDGRGFDLGRPTSGNGLRNIIERARALRGTASIQSSCGSGTVVMVAVPVAR